MQAAYLVCTLCRRTTVCSAYPAVNLSFGADVSNSSALLAMAFDLLLTHLVHSSGAASDNNVYVATTSTIDCHRDTASARPRTSDTGERLQRAYGQSSGTLTCLEAQHSIVDDISCTILAACRHVSLDPAATRKAWSACEAILSGPSSSAYGVSPGVSAPLAAL